MSRSNSTQGLAGADGAADDVDVPNPPAHYAQRADAGDETWIEDAIEDYLGICVGEAQRRICRAVATNKQVLVVSANSLGKSYILAAITIVWLFCRYPAVSFATSGTERKMKRTYCKPVEALHSDARIPLPGEYKHRPPRIEIEGVPEHFFEASSPRDAGELEGVHSAFTLAIIEEADKAAVDKDVIEAMRSLASDDRDRLIAIANPPEDETNSIYPLIDDHPNWEVLRFSTFDAHNVQVSMGNIDASKIDGIADISKLEDDWVEYNASEWPGLETALRVSAPKLGEDGHLVFERDDALEDNLDFRPDLAKRWHRRRAGIMPPDGARVHRPFTLDDVESAWKRGDILEEEQQFADWQLPKPIGSAIDVARETDRTVLETIHGDIMRIHYCEQGTNHVDQANELEEILETMPRHPIVVDFIGSGQAIHDLLAESFPDVGKFEANAEASQSADYYDKWSEGMDALGDWLDDGGVIQHRGLRKEMKAAAREVEFSENYYASRGGADGTKVYELSSKDDIKDRLDASPDILDAGMMAAWVADDETSIEDDSGGDWMITV